MKGKISEFEVMAPVGSRESLAAAIQAGADSVYFGIGKLNMRSHSANHFNIDDLREIAATCNEHGIKTYLTVNNNNKDNNNNRKVEKIKNEHRYSCSLNLVFRLFVKRNTKIKIKSL